ncbi:MAG: hypothetical protein MZV64_74220 [Ignavibacteriales bacterium]|nr:hypothetical protein [Ignavibacteriales bacterium]
MKDVQRRHPRNRAAPSSNSSLRCAMERIPFFSSPSSTASAIAFTWISESAEQTTK